MGAAIHGDPEFTPAVVCYDVLESVYCFHMLYALILLPARICTFGNRRQKEPILASFSMTTGPWVSFSVLSL
ncbi:hypothetical protein CCP3SC1AL1_3950003 [Gammaproteobacteria bacterium]